MTFLRVILSFMIVGALSSCDLKKEKNTAPKPPPAPKKAKPTLIKPKAASEEKKEVKAQEPAIVEWEGGAFSARKSFKEADLVLVLFYADWSEHCQAFNPLLEGMTKKEDQKIRLLRINADLFPDLANQYKVDAVPKILIFNGQDKQTGEFVGSISEGKLNTIIKNSTATDSLSGSN